MILAQFVWKYDEEEKTRVLLVICLWLFVFIKLVFIVLFLNSHPKIKVIITHFIL